MVLADKEDLRMEVYGRLLGAPQLRLAHTNYDPPLTKATMLLYYLAYKGEWCSRDELLYLFYPDTAEETARSSLRQLLTSIRRLPYSRGLETEATRIRWEAATDVQVFKQAVSERQWPKAIELYRGKLLEGCTLAGAPEFEPTLELGRGELQGIWREAMLSFAGQLGESCRYADAAELLERLYKADPLDETVLQHLVTALYGSGERHKALVAFETFAQTLWQELGGEPEEATLQLTERIKKGEPLGVTAAHKAVSQTAAARPQRRTLPLQATPFVGRQVEKVGLAEQLADPSCRLLTIVGAGGMGKTRLAVEVAALQEEAFTDGVAFTSFASNSSHDSMVSALADALDFAFFGPDEPKRQLLTHLRDKELLLVLDNLEHLLEDMSLVVEILETAPRIKLLATSREPLKLHAEWLFDLEGLSYLRATAQATPSAEVTEHQGIDCDATRLFVQSARKARADFALNETAVRAVMRVCQLVEGMPLALELAAGWLRVLTPEDIATEIEKGLDLLEGSTRDLPPRHRSLRAVFDHSWCLLSEGEREALRKLSVFRGGFSREAAAQVADVSLPLLLSLSNKSLLRTNASKRFERHPLVWQYSREKADAYPDQRAEARNCHCAYYAVFLHEQEKWIQGGEKQREALSKIEEEIGNIRVAWRWAIEQRDLSALKLSLESLHTFFYIRGLFQEGEEAFSAAVECLAGDSVTLSRLLVAQAVFAWQRNHIDTAQAACERSLAMLKRLGAPPSTRALLHLGIVHVLRGHLEEAEQLHLEGLAVAEASGDLYGIGRNLNMLAEVATERGSLKKAEGYFHKSIAAFRQSQDRRGLAMALNNLGFLLSELGRMEAAKACYQESLEYATEIGNFPGIGNALTNLGRLSYQQKNYRQAESYYLESLSIWRRLEDANMVFALTGLGKTAHALHDYRTSITYFAEALTTAIRLGDSTDVAECVVGAADLLVSLGEREKALMLLAFALRQQGLEQEVKDRAEHLYAKLLAQSPEAAVAAAQSQDTELNDIRKMLVLLQQPEQHGGAPTT